MSAFAQHDEMDFDDLIVEGGECAFCDLPIVAHNEGILVAIHQILVADGTSYLTCERCWWKAWHGAKATDVSNIGGVNVIHAVSKPFVAAA